MPTTIKLRSLTTEEETETRNLAASLNAAHWLVQLAKIIVAMLNDPKLCTILGGSQTVSVVGAGINCV